MASISKHISKDGKVSWRVRVRVNGRYEGATFPTRKDTQEWALKTEHTISPFALSISNFLNFKLPRERNTQPQPLQDVLLQP